VEDCEAKKSFGSQKILLLSSCRR